SVLYDWRLNGDALPLSERMRGRTGGVRKKFACPVEAAPKATSAGTAAPNPAAAKPPRRK
ncbi:MAG TPA: hypothetical protein VNS59_08910, partial [Lysobacter sp.]|nr:hypothetical protein [Lysobacter sp.]